MDALWHDVRFALRSFRRSPTFTLVSIATLAIGIGVATATFTVANGILFRPLPIRAQDRVIVLWAKQRDFAHVPVRWSDIDRFARASRAFEHIGGIDYNGAWTWAMFDRGEPAPTTATWVTGGFFGVLDVVPQVGRVIQPSDDVPNAPRVAVISDGLWRRRYGADPSIVGHALTYDGKQLTIIGVAPRGFEYPQGVELWTALLPFSPNARSDSASGSLDIVARLRSGATMEQGRRELDAFLDRAYSRWRASIGKFEATARTLPALIVGGVEQRLLTLLAAAGLVMIIASLNVANLLLVRAVARAREVAIRASLGATRRRIVAQLMTESTILGVAGVVVGVGIAVATVRILRAVAPPEVPRLQEATLDGRVLVFACSLAFIAVLAFGLGPSLALVRGSAGTAIRYAGSRAATDSRASTRTKHALLVVQAALSVIVLAAAGLLGRSLLNLERLSLGFERDRLVIAQLAMPWSKFATADGSDRFGLLLGRLQEATKALPGVTSVAVSASPPYSGTGGWDALPNVDGDAGAAARRPWVNMEVVTSDYFATLGIPLVVGRLPSLSDRKGAPPVVVVNETMAARYWPGESALGKRLGLGAASDTSAPRYTVVGIVRDTRYRQLTTAMPGFYVPSAQYAGAFPTWFMVRTARSPASVIPSLRRSFLAVDADASVLGVRTMDDYLSGPLARPRFSSALGALYGAVSLVLIAVGIAAVIGEHVRQRRRELGIRFALGARTGDVRRDVLRTAFWPVAIGIALGTTITLITGPLVASQLFDVEPTDPLALVAAVGVVLAVSGLACIGPARHAARVNPVEVLRAD